ncbi:MAG: ABC transporter permease [Bryobacteraceae bacterium]|jgi:putative ABC transport system permease protein
MHPLVGDLRRGVRLWWKSRVLAALALVALALGIGATTAIFSVVNAVLLQPLPFRQADQLLVIVEKNIPQQKNDLYVAGINIDEWRRRSRTVQGVAAIFDGNPLILTGGPGGRMEAEEVKSERVSANLFPLLGVQPALGRGFLASEDAPGPSSVAVLSYELWQRRFGADPSIPGKSIRLRGSNYTVVGVLPAGFSVIEPGVDVWTPLNFDISDPRVASGRSLTAIARLRRGATFEQAVSEFDSMGAGLEAAYPAIDSGYRAVVRPLAEQIVGKTRQSLLVLLAAVGLLLAIACANVANLLLARGATRRKEIAVRAALGASRLRITVQLLAESVLLALAGGALGAVLASAAVTLVARLGRANLPRLAQIHADWRLLLFAVIISFVTGVLFGMAPALQISSGNLNAALVESGRGGTVGRSGRALRSGLVVLEIALALVMLIGATLLARSFNRLRSVKLGFEASNLLTVRLPFSGGTNAAPPRRVAFLHAVMPRLAALPGVRSVGACSALPLTGLEAGVMFTIADRPAPPPDQRPMALTRSVAPDYFRAMGIPLVAGREFTDADTNQSPAVAVIDQALARRFFPGASPLGGRLALDWSPPVVAQVVGVVGSVRPETVQGEDWATIYSPYDQRPSLATNIVIRTAGEPLALAASVRGEVRRLDPEQPMGQMRTGEAIVAQAVSGARLSTLLLGLFGVIAFVLAAVGIYGVVSYDVGERVQELGIRMALGAQKSDVLSLILGHAARLAALGIALGLAGALALTRLMASMLFGIHPRDFGSYAAAAVGLAVVALTASYLPARRAMALDPVRALRHE